jgi:hypothetical protein
VARLGSPRELARGDAVSLEVDPDGLHLFAADGRALGAA